MFKYLLLLSILLNYVQIAQGKLISPPEASHFSKITSHAEMMTYLRALDKENPNMELKVIGESVQGREIPALFFTTHKKFAVTGRVRPLVLLFCQQHGNEPSGKEAALILARRLAGSDKSILENLDLILVPQVNPDGGEVLKRRNAHNMDLNRNHVILSEPESQALHNLFLKWMPEVTLDMHEYNAITSSWLEQGYVKDAAEMLGGVTNLNIDAGLTRFSRETVLPEVGAKIRDAGFTFHRYIVGSPFDHGRVRFSTTNINDGRQSMGIYNTLSFIIEGKRYGPPDNKIEVRTRGQLAAQQAFLKTIGEHGSQIVSMVKQARQQLLTRQPQKRSFIQMDYYEDPEQKQVLFPVFDLKKWQTVERPLKPFAATVKVQKSVRVPLAYLFSAQEEELLAILKRHRIQMQVLKSDSQLEVQVRTIMHVTDGVNEDKSTKIVDVETVTESRSFARGSILVPLQQPAANLIPLLLEAQSTFSLCQKRNGHQYWLENYLQPGKTYPIYRLLGNSFPETEPLN